MNDLVPYLIFTIVLVTIAVVAGRAIRQRRTKPPTALPAWISRKPEHFQPGEEYCELRADFNYTDDKPATSRVTIYSFNSEKRGSEVLSDRMTERDFHQQRDNLKHEGWREEHKSVDREGESYFYRRPKR
jgi:hypothetical protein